MERLIYLDNAATSFPKPEGVYEAVLQAMRENGGNSGRSGHRLSLAAGRIVQDARMQCARLFGAPSSAQIIFTSNATMALNIAIKGTLAPGEHVITSSLEHNAVARPLHALAQTGVTVTKLPTDLQHGLNADAVKKALRSNTKLVVCTHVSNVTGTVNDIASIGALCRENRIVFLVDAAQSAGSRHIDVEKMCIDLLAFPGHKGLLGPQGTGGLYVRLGLELKTMIEGGTGSASESLAQPEAMPEKFESGTLNAPGLAGLAAGVRFIMEQGVEAIGQREAALTNRLIEGISDMTGIAVIGPGAGQGRAGVVSVRFEKLFSEEAALLLDTAFHIAVRGGLHCAGDAHRSIDARERGDTLRISPYIFNSEEEIDQCLAALEICAKGV